MGKKARIKRQKQPQALPEERTRRGIAGTWYYIIRYIAIASMLTDHLGEVLYYAGQLEYSAYIFCKMVGRIAFPLFAFELVECFHYTKDRKKHLLRLGGLALISELPFDVALVLEKPLNFTARAVWYQNICLSLFLSFLMLIITDKIQSNTFSKLYKSEKVRRFACWSVRGITAGVFAAIAWALGADYLWRGIVLAALFGFARGRKHIKLWQGIAVFAFVLSMGSNFLIYLPAFFALLIIYLAECQAERQGEKEERKGKLGTVLASKPSKYFCRFFYPAHLVALAVVRTILTA